MVHHLGQISIWGFYQKMIMVVHQSIAPDLELSKINRVYHAIEENPVIVSLIENAPFLDSSGEDMVNRIRKLDSLLSWHNNILNQKLTIYYTAPDKKFKSNPNKDSYIKFSLLYQ